MGTRADFYVGSGTAAEWIGSVAFDGYEWAEDKTHPIRTADSPQAFRTAVALLLSQREDATLPPMGWPWPWPDSRTTDYAYMHDGGKVVSYAFGRQCDENGRLLDPEVAGHFPDMRKVQQVTLGPRSGLIVLGIDVDKGEA